MIRAQLDLATKAAPLAAESVTNSPGFAVDLPAERFPKPRTFAAWVAQRGLAGETAITDVNLPVLVIGAGPAGLAAMNGLKQAGVEFQAVECHSEVGGIWNTSNPLSSVYDSLTTNTSRHTTHLGFPMPSDWPAFPGHRQLLGYLRNFADKQGLNPHIQFRTAFEQARKTNRGTWIASLRTLDNQQTVSREVRAIIVATGVHNKNNPVYPETLRDQALASGLDVVHSCEYRNPEPYAGKRVLVVGLGVSGTDIANEVSRVAVRTLLTFRAVPWIVPLNIFGRPADRAAVGMLGWVPFALQRQVFRLIQAATIGSLRRYGLPAADHRLLDRFVVNDRGFVAALKENRVLLRPTATRIERGLAHFEDSSFDPEPIDAIIFATGYARRYPLLNPDDYHARPLSEALAFLIFHRVEPGTVFMVETITPTGCWPLFIDQGRAVAAYFAAEQRGGRNLDAFNARRALPSPDFKRNWYREADGYHVSVRAYSQCLRQLAAWLSE